VFGGSFSIAPAAAAVTDSTVGVTNCPAAFWTCAYDRLFCFAYASSA
jgi:hypothetical protein